ncbi:MAG TPA: fumarylacetoacetate hydrolase family protein [Vicinamibacteria bacterium]|nr:fumarylacetoacetate hydrolase family protein [Vicinamibacteria bacterium]
MKSRAGRIVGCALALAVAARASAQVTKYVRYAERGQETQTHYGVLEGDTIRELDGSPIDGAKPTGKTVGLASVRLLAPVEPSKVIAVGLNYKSHLGGQTPSKVPPLFAKLPTCIVGPEADIVYPEGASNVHFEGELVIVIGKKASRISKEEASDYVFGVTAGNDVSERNWQQEDLQWFRAKASDTFGPIGPAVVTGLNYNDLLLQTRLNGEVLQKQRTSDLLFDVEDIVSFTSQFVTLDPGDVIFTGTPGTTSAMKPGDVVEIEVEGVGILRNRIATSGTDH